MLSTQPIQRRPPHLKRRVPKAREASAAHRSSSRWTAAGGVKHQAHSSSFRAPGTHPIVKLRTGVLPPSSFVRRTEGEPKDQGRYVEPATSLVPTYVRQPRRFDSRQQQLCYFFLSPKSFPTVRAITDQIFPRQIQTQTHNRGAYFSPRQILPQPRARTFSRYLKSDRNFEFHLEFSNRAKANGIQVYK